MSGYAMRSSQTRATPSQDSLTQAGLDPALAQALLMRNPLAIAASAGILDNSLIAAAIGRSSAREDSRGSDSGREDSGREDSRGSDSGREDSRGSDSGREDGRVATTDRTDAREGETERGREWAQHDIDDRGMEEHTEDGSGEHGRLDPNLADHANHAFWRGVAVSAEGAGLVNAARHMHHFLDNSGAELQVDLDILEATCPIFTEDVQQGQLEAIDQALAMLEASDSTQANGGDLSEMLFTRYFVKSSAPDWFFAIGGNTRRLNGSYSYEPDSDGSGNGTLHFDADWSLEDRYNWDGGKSVTIGGVTVNDEVLGRLHVVGLAQEFDIRGARSDSFSARYTGQSPGTASPSEDEDGGREQRTGRDNLDRDRR